MTEEVRNILPECELAKVFNKIFILSNIGKKIVTIQAENFCLNEDRCHLYKYLLEMRVFRHTQVFAQISGPLHGDIEKAILNTQHFEPNVRLVTLKCNEAQDIEKLCEEIKSLVSTFSGRNPIFVINDVSRVILAAKFDPSFWRHFLRTIHQMSSSGLSHFILFNQNSPSSVAEKLLRELECISDGYMRIRRYEYCLKHDIWYFDHDMAVSTLMRPKTKTCYILTPTSSSTVVYTRAKQVRKNYNPDFEAQNFFDKSKTGTGIDFSTLAASDDEDEKDLTQPYTQAAKPEQSRIFFYPDKEDDFDEDDPDGDLNI